MKTTTLLAITLLLNTQMLAMEKTLDEEKSIKHVTEDTTEKTSQDTTESSTQPKEGWHIPGVPYGTWGSATLIGAAAIFMGGIGWAAKSVFNWARSKPVKEKISIPNPVPVPVPVVKELPWFERFQNYLDDGCNRWADFQELKQQYSAQLSPHELLLKDEMWLRNLNSEELMDLITLLNDWVKEYYAVSLSTILKVDQPDLKAVALKGNAYALLIEQKYLMRLYDGQAEALVELCDEILRYERLHSSLIAEHIFQQKQENDGLNGWWNTNKFQQNPFELIKENPQIFPLIGNEHQTVRHILQSWLESYYNQTILQIMGNSPRATFIASKFDERTSLLSGENSDLKLNRMQRSAIEKLLQEIELYEKQLPEIIV